MIQEVLNIVWAIPRCGSTDLHACGASMDSIPHTSQHTGDEDGYEMVSVYLGAWVSSRWM